MSPRQLFHTISFRPSILFPKQRTATMSSGKFAGDTAPGAGDSGQDETSQEGDDQCFAADALVKQKADTQSPSRPPNFVRVYGSAGISRVKRSLRGWFA